MTRQVTVDIDGGILLVIQDIVRMYGLITASVFGRMWDFCTREDGVCRASMETIGNDLGIDRATANRCAKKLVQEGYLEDLTPELRNHPHIYRDTGKAGLRMSITAHSGVAQNNTGVAQNNTRKNEKKAGVAQNNTRDGRYDAGVAQCNTKASGVALDHMINVVVVKPLTDSYREQQQQRAHDLIRAGVSPEKAAQLAQDFLPDRIGLAIDVYSYMRHFKKARGAGYLVKFLEQDWSPPAEYVPADQRCDECWQPENDHSKDCSQRKSEWDVICPYCHTYPCSCEEDEDPQASQEPKKMLEGA